MQQLISQVVLSSWPWRLGTVVYEPLLTSDLASWQLSDLEEQPFASPPQGLASPIPQSLSSQWLGIPAALLDPRKESSARGRALLAYLEADQQMLLSAFQLVSPEAQQVCLELSELPEQQLSSWLSERGLSIEDISLANLEGFLEMLLSWEAEDHHALLADWWEQWEIPHRPGPSAFRTECGPKGTVFASYGDQARSVWLREVESTDLDSFSLWSALRVHWAWRIEFADQPWPGLAVLPKLNQLRF